MSDKEVIIDTKPLLLSIDPSTGKQRTLSDLGNDNHCNKETIRQWNHKAPGVVKFLYNEMMKTGKTFFELVKEKETEEKQ